MMNRLFGVLYLLSALWAWLAYMAFNGSPADALVVGALPFAIIVMVQFVLFGFRPRS